MLQIVIPAYNEESRLPRTLRALRRHVSRHQREIGRVEVIVVDNASTDRTAEVAWAANSTAMPVRVVSCLPRGKGAAVRAGLLATDADWIGFMDADGATDLDALQAGLARLRSGADVVVGSRGLAGSRTQARHSRIRESGARAYRACSARIVPEIADTQCGFKLFEGDVARQAAFRMRTRGFAFDVELLARLRGAGARIEELPVTWVDVPGSTFDPMRHGVKSFAQLAGIAWRGRHDGFVRPATPAVPATQPATGRTARHLAVVGGE